MFGIEFGPIGLVIIGAGFIIVFLAILTPGPRKRRDTSDLSQQSRGGQ